MAHERRPDKTSQRLKTSLFDVPNRVEFAYRKQIFNLVNREIPTGLTAFNIDEWLDQLASVSEDSTYLKHSEMVSRAMVRDTSLSNSWAWREHSRGSAEGARVRRILHETSSGSLGREILSQVSESSENLGTLPLRLSLSLRKEVLEAREKGATEQGCLNILRYRFPLVVSKRIKMIARSDPHRVSSAITRARSEDLVLNCFIWTTRHDTLVRHAHKNLDGVVVFWGDLPSPELLVGLGSALGHYGPGETYNCRCIAIPVLSVNDLFRTDRSIIEVYREGRIHRVTKAKFLEIAT